MPTPAHIRAGGLLRGSAHILVRRGRSGRSGVAMPTRSVAAAVRRRGLAGTSEGGATPATRKRLPVIRYGLAAFLVASGAFVSVGAYALNDERARAVWVDNKHITGGETSLGYIQSGIDRARNLKVDDVQRGASDAMKTAEKTYNETKEASEQLYNRASEAVATATNSAKEATEAAKTMYTNTKDSVVSTYENTSQAIKGIGEKVRSFTSQTFQTFEDLKESIVGKRTPSSPPPVPPPSEPPAKAQTREIQKESPTVPNPPVTKEKVEKSPSAVKKKVEATAKSPKEETSAPATPVAVDGAAKEEKAAQASIPTDSIKKTSDPQPAVAPSETSQLSEAGSIDGTSAPIVASTSSVEKKEELEQEPGALKSEKPSKVKKSRKKKSASLLSEIDAVLAPIGDSPNAVELRRVMQEVALTLDSLSSSKKYAEPVAAARQNLKELAVQVASLNLGDSDAQAVLKEQAERFTAIMRQRDEEFENVFNEIQKSGRAELTERLSEARKEFELELDARLSEQATRYLEVLDTELQSQSAELENQWKKRARTMVDNERDGRLAKLDNLVLKLKQLEKISLDTSDYLRSSHIGHIQAAALEAVNAALSEDHQTPFVRELELLRRFSKGDEVLGLAVGAISEDIARRGLVPIEEFTRELSTLEASIRRVQLMPERGGPISYVVSNLLSVFVFPKHGMVAGGDVEAILARAQHHMARGNLDGAAREINQLKGWPKKMAADWLSAAREHLEVKQALEVAECHIQLKSLGLV